MNKRETAITEDHNLELAAQRLQVLWLAEELHNVSEACRRSGVNRASFYEWKRRFQAYGIEGLKKIPTIPLNHPQKTMPEVEETIIATSLQHPSWGCCKLSRFLKQQGISVSSPTIQKILIRHSFGKEYQRILWLEEKHLNEGKCLTFEQLRGIEKLNPCFRERRMAAKRPGELLVQDTFYVGTIQEEGRLYLHAIIDTYGSFAFGFLHTSNGAECTVSVLHKDVLPFYWGRDISVTTVLVGNDRISCQKVNNLYEIYNAIEYRRTNNNRPHRNGFAERFKKTVMDEFFRIKFRENVYTSFDVLQKDFGDWLYYYNYERPHLGYRNMGKCPGDMIEDYISTVRKMQLDECNNYIQLDRWLQSV